MSRRVAAVGDPAMDGQPLVPSVSSLQSAAATTVPSPSHRGSVRPSPTQQLMTMAAQPIVAYGARLEEDTEDLVRVPQRLGGLLRGSDEELHRSVRLVAEEYAAASRGQGAQRQRRRRRRRQRQQTPELGPPMMVALASSDSTAAPLVPARTRRRGRNAARREPAPETESLLSSPSLPKLSSGWRGWQRAVAPQLPTTPDRSVAGTSAQLQLGAEQANPELRLPDFRGSPNPKSVLRAPDDVHDNALQDGPLAVPQHATRESGDDDGPASDSQVDQCSSRVKELLGSSSRALLDEVSQQFLQRELETGGLEVQPPVVQEMVAESRLRWRSACAREALSSQVSHLSRMVAQMKSASVAEEEELDRLNLSGGGTTTTDDSEDDADAQHCLMSPGHGDGGDGAAASGGLRQWNWAQAEQAKVLLARRKQEAAAQEEVERLQGLLQSYHAKMSEGERRAALMAEAEQERLREQQRQSQAKLAQAARLRKMAHEEVILQKKAVAEGRKVVAAEQKHEVELAQQRLTALQQMNRKQRQQQSAARREALAQRLTAQQAAVKAALEVPRARRPEFGRWKRKPNGKHSGTRRGSGVGRELDAEASQARRREAQRLDALMVLARAKARAGLFKDAVAEAEQAVELAPQSVGVLRCYADCLRGLGRFREAAAAYERAIGGLTQQQRRQGSSGDGGGGYDEDKEEEEVAAAVAAELEGLGAELRGMMEEERERAEASRLANLPVYDSPLCLGRTGQQWTEVD